MREVKLVKRAAAEAPQRGDARPPGARWTNWAAQFRAEAELERAARREADRRLLGDLRRLGEDPGTDGVRRTTEGA